MQTRHSRDRASTWTLLILNPNYLWFSCTTYFTVLSLSFEHNRHAPTFAVSFLDFPLWSLSVASLYLFLRYRPPPCLAPFLLSFVLPFPACYAHRLNPAIPFDVYNYFVLSLSDGSWSWSLVFSLLFPTSSCAGADADAGCQIKLHSPYL
jgi:hypothetical protein